MRTPEELQNLANIKMLKDSNKSGSASTEGNLKELLKNPGQIVILGSGEGRRRVPTNPMNSKNAQARANLIKKGDVIDEAPMRRGMPSHEQYAQMCVKHKLQYQVSHDGFVIWHPSYGLPPEKYNEEEHGLNIDPNDFQAEGAALYNLPKVQDPEAPAANDDQVVLSKKQFSNLMSEFENLKSKVEKMDEKHPPKKWNNYVARLINEGRVDALDCIDLYTQLNRELNKDDIAPFIMTPESSSADS